MKTSQVYSVVICNKSFNLTLKKEAFDDGYWSSPENEMDKKYEKSTVEDPSLEARSRRCARGEKFFPFPPGEASIEAPGQPRRERERVSLKSFFQSQSLSRRGEVRSIRSRPSCSVPPPQISGRNSRNSRSQDCLQVEKGGSTSSQLPPPHVSKKDLYKFKMENYVFCPVHYVHFVKYDVTVSFYDAVSDTIRRRGGDRGIFTEEGVDTVAYFGGNHGFRV